jgi:hypothetical protein
MITYKDLIQMRFKRNDEGKETSGMNFDIITNRKETKENING